MVKLSALFRDWLPMARACPTLPNRFFLWVNAVGGYWVCLGDAVTIGRPAPQSEIDIPILGDLAKRHAVVRRDGEGYLIEALREVRVEGKPVSGVAELRHGNVVQLGQGVKLAFRRPHALRARRGWISSAITARSPRSMR